MYHIYQTRYGNIAIDLTRPQWIVKMSGGYDSSVLLYVLANTVHKRNLADQIVIRPVTAQKVGNKRNDPQWQKRDPVDTVEKVIDFTRAKFPDVNIHPSRIQPVSEWWVGTNYTDAQEMHSEALSQELGLPLTDFVNYNGVTKNPPVPMKSDNFEQHRVNNAEYGDNLQGTVTVSMMGDIEGLQEPWRNADKRIVFEIADQLGVVEDMMAMTWSCEGWVHNTNNFEHTCGECWWCQEREWAYQEYKK